MVVLKRGENRNQDTVQIPKRKNGKKKKKQNPYKQTLGKPRKQMI